MNDIDKFIELVITVCRRPRMFTLNGTFGEVAAYISGLVAGSDSSPVSRDISRAFNFFVTTRLLVADKYAWPGAIHLVAADDADAINRLRDLLVEFVTLRKSKSLHEICSDAANKASEYKETEPAKVWRNFLAARYTADQAEIEPLIMPHPNASVLWCCDPTPPGVAAQLNAISDSYVVSVVAGSVESGYVQLITAIGKVDAHLVDGIWRIDAGPFIEIKNRDA